MVCISPSVNIKVLMNMLLVVKPNGLEISQLHLTLSFSDSPPTILKFSVVNLKKVMLVYTLMFKTVRKLV